MDCDADDHRHANGIMQGHENGNQNFESEGFGSCEPSFNVQT